MLVLKLCSHYVHFSLYQFIIERSPSNSRSSSFSPRSSSSSPSRCKECVFTVNEPSIERPQASRHNTSDGGQQISTSTLVSATETANAASCCQEYPSPQLATIAGNEHSLRRPQETSHQKYDSSDSVAPVRTATRTITTKWYQEMQVPRPHPTLAINEQSPKFPQTSSYLLSHYCNPATTPIRTETKSTTTWCPKMQIPRPHPTFAIHSQSSKFSQTRSYPWSGCSSSKSPFRSETAATTTGCQKVLIPQSRPTPAKFGQSPKFPPAGSYPWSSKAPFRTETAKSVTWGKKLIGPPPLCTPTINGQSCNPASIPQCSLTPETAIVSTPFRTQSVTAKTGVKSVTWGKKLIGPPPLCTTTINGRLCYPASIPQWPSTPETIVTTPIRTQSVTVKTGCQEPLNLEQQSSTHDSSRISSSTLEHTRLTPSSDNSLVGNRSKGFSSQTMQENPRDIPKAFSSVAVSSHSMSCHEATRDVPQIESNNSGHGDDSALLSRTLPKTEDFLNSLHTSSPRGKIASKYQRCHFLKSVKN